MEAQEAVKAINAQFCEAFNRGDATAVASFYVEDAALLAPDQAAVRGKRAIEESFTEVIKEIGGTIRIEPVEVVAAGNIAYQWANYSTKGGKKSVTGKFVEIYNRQTDGSWKIRLTIYNNDTPLPGGSP
jgi:uncharacterized protein (TIGR02246 family)